MTDSGEVGLLNAQAISPREVKDVDGPPDDGAAIHCSPTTTPHHRPPAGSVSPAGAGNEEEEEDEEEPFDTIDPSTSLIQMDEEQDPGLCATSAAADADRNPCIMCLAVFSQFFDWFPMVLFMFILTLVDVSFLLYEYVSQSERFEYVTLFTSFAFMTEVTVRFGHLGYRRFVQFNKWWMLAEAIIVTTSFLVEYTEFVIDRTLPQHDFARYVAYMRAIRFFRVAIVFKIRSRTIPAAVRRLVSADRRRFQEDGFDLDLTYVHKRIIAMSWPSEGKEAIYRNHIDAVARFLETRHRSRYQVYNLCSERSYDESKFHYRVVRCKMDDHNPCELLMMRDFARQVQTYLDVDQKRVAVIHCKGGKGRTGTMVCSYLLASGFSPSADAALRRFGSLRTSANARAFQGVESPSQDRYVHYLERLLKLPDQTPLPRTVRIRRLAITGLPHMWWDVGRLWCAIVTSPSTERTTVYQSNPAITFTHHLQATLPTGSSNGTGEGSTNNGHTKSPVRNSSIIPTTSFGGFTVPEVGPPRKAGDIPAFFDGFEAIRIRARGTAPEKAEAVPPALYATRLADLVRTTSGKGPSSSNGDGALVPSESSRVFEGASASSAVGVSVDVEFDVKGIPSVSGDVVVKVFFNVDNPNTLKCPMQAWFHTSFEENTIMLGRPEVDGPHKDHRQKKFGDDFRLHIELETVDPIE